MLIIIQSRGGRMKSHARYHCAPSIEARGIQKGLCFVFTLRHAAKSLQSCPTLCDIIDGSPPGSAVPGILRARILEWVAWPAREAGAASTWWKQQGWVHMPGPWASLLRREPPSETGPSLTNTLGAGSWAPRVPPFTRCQIAAEPWVSCTPGVWG